MDPVIKKVLEEIPGLVADLSAVKTFQQGGGHYEDVTENICDGYSCGSRYVTTREWVMDSPVVKPDHVKRQRATEKIHQIIPNLQIYCNNLEWYQILERRKIKSVLAGF